MNSFEINLEVKRPRKIYKVMDYVIMFGVVIFAAVIIVFLPYVNKIKAEKEMKESENVAKSRYQQLQLSEQEITKNTAADTQFKKDHDTIGDAIKPVHVYLQSLNDFANHYELKEDGTPRYIINSQTITGNVISLTIKDSGDSNRVIEFKNALLDNPEFYYENAEGILVVDPIDLSWISSVEMAASISDNTISLEVTYGK